MSERFRLEWHSPGVLAIGWARGTSRVRGDCLVNAIQEKTDPKAFIEKQKRPDHTKFTNLMTFAEARQFIAQNPRMLGSQIHDCLGLKLMDARQILLFSIPLQIQNK
ncbi:MAG: hypothetical protein A2754_03150 [Candidatus Magasanikbacteria bacterium RIFCSPHIGHO2_01_FULL_47_8]|uniref:Uncharacterized protein n=1 Tax=Candidatus Magasanikbacteria bacterium RIFCSPHIGHO2_01_FULL_47_8 TaxID=1798673 RepID=A0A1F6MFC4_9BACT|nr:MAG: hypothetical protein A2754_03150 [Candidatus Magasanikbacteria bacterium RIFCSPHIGHO2_01_FULL_47_8]